METVTDLIFFGFKVTADGDCSMKLKDADSLEGELSSTQTAYSKAETLLCRQKSVQSKLWFFPQLCMDVRVEL